MRSRRYFHQHFPSNFPLATMDSCKPWRHTRWRYIRVFLCSVEKPYFEASARACAAHAWPARSPGPNDCRLVLPSFRFGKSGTLDILSYALASRSHNRVKKHKTREAGHLLYAVLETREEAISCMRCLCCTLHPACNHLPRCRESTRVRRPVVPMVLRSNKAVVLISA